MKTILVTGSNGFLGHKLTELILKNKQFALVATSKGINRFPLKEGYKYIDLDVNNKAQLAAVLTQVQPDAVIHTAALTNADVCEAALEKCQQLNVIAVEVIAALCAQLKIQLLLLSTDFIFDGLNGPYSEVSMPNPLNNYGKSKLLAEQAVIASGTPYTIIRTILVYGVIADRTRSNIVLWAKNELETGANIKVVNDQWRMPTLVDDLASACLVAVEKAATGIFNVSGNEMMSIVEIVQKVATTWELDKRLIQEVSASSFTNVAERPRATGFIIEKAMRELGYQPHSFEAGLALVKRQINASQV